MIDLLKRGKIHAPKDTSILDFALANGDPSFASKKKQLSNPKFLTLAVAFEQFFDDVLDFEKISRQQNQYSLFQLSKQTKKRLPRQASLELDWSLVPPEETNRVLAFINQPGIFEFSEIRQYFVPLVADPNHAPSSLIGVVRSIEDYIEDESGVEISLEEYRQHLPPGKSYGPGGEITPDED